MKEMKGGYENMEEFEISMRRFLEGKFKIFTTHPIFSSPLSTTQHQVKGRPRRIIYHVSILSKYKTPLLISPSGKNLKVTIRCILDSSC